MEIDSNTITWIWFVAGILIMLSEIFAPGLVVIFLGAAAIVVAIGRWAGLIESTTASFGVWIVTSLLLVVSLRRMLTKYFPSDTSYQSAEEDSDAFGTVVEVVETVSPDHDRGRIRYQGTTWPAMSQEGTIPSGKKAKLICRNNLAWIVEPSLEADDFGLDLRSVKE